MDEGWEFASAPAGRIMDPSTLDGEKLDWLAASVPCTAAAALRAAGRWSFDVSVDFDASDWWWRRRFACPLDLRSIRVLHFDGLATVADVWLNGSLVVHSEDMFLAHEIDVGHRLRDENELVICCRALSAAVQARRPRPAWRTRLVPTTQLRWFRTTLLGRGPAWSPRAAPVGPWRPIFLEERLELSVERRSVRARIDADDGVVDAEITFDVVSGSAPENVILQVAGYRERMQLEMGERHDRFTARGSLHLPKVERWWPHTHGTPTRHPIQIEVTRRDRSTRVDFGTAGFRTVAMDSTDDGFAIGVNGVDVFCRGACWTSVDAVALTGTPAAYRETLEAARSAGMNMLRVCGPFFYEADLFYDLCDELGILVWQDYAFANMDYPGDDRSFLALVDREARCFLERTQLACSVSVLCGNSEVEQQAAMIGAGRDSWRPPLFSTTLANLTRDLRPDVVYWPSTPSGGALPFLTDTGTAHYFGVGAYLRPLEDARRADVRFATECLAFANVPDDPVVDTLMNDRTPPQDPRWKQRVPRDGGTGWDFDDVRDHYFRTLFRLDPLTVRYADVPRYLALSRVITGEVMAATFTEWRRRDSRCRGALVWFLRDLWPGAGWGLLDSDGRPKAAYYYVRRALQPVAVLLTDEGLNGLDVHVFNERSERLEATAQIALFRGDLQVSSGAARINLQPRGVAMLRAAALFDQFHDATYAYRFGPPQHDLSVATLLEHPSGAVLGEAFHFPQGIPSHQESELGLEATATRGADGTAWRLAVRTRGFAQSVFLDIRGFSPDDNHFHIAPGRAREVLLKPTGAIGRPVGEVRALNSRSTTKISVKD